MAKYKIQRPLKSHNHHKYAAVIMKRKSPPNQKKLKIRTTIRLWKVVRIFSFAHRATACQASILA